MYDDQIYQYDPSIYASHHHSTLLWQIVYIDYFLKLK